MSSYKSNKPRGFGFSGFSIGSKAEKAEKKPPSSSIPPDPASGISKHGYSTWSAISKNAIAASIGMPKERAQTEEEYFNDDDEDTGASGLAYIPAPGSPSAVNDNQESDEDPLDAFMEGIQKQVQKEAVVIKPIEKEDPLKGIRDDIEGMDDEESYYKYMDENPNAGKLDEESDIELEYDEEGNPIVPLKKHIDPLPPIDHSCIEYKDFEKNFYEVHPEIEELSSEKVGELRNALGIKVSGASPPKPVSSFGHLGFDDTLMKAIRKSEFTQPTPIQAQGIPVILSGRDIIGIAKTGSGKTAAFLWPMLIHICDQPRLKPGDGPVGLILAPTRELSLQIYNEAKKFGKFYNIHVVCCYGGGSKWEQSKALEEGAEIIVATPGRMIDMVKMKATNLQRVTYLVLDEADRMFDMGFEPQVRSICNHVRPNRQTMLFSATFKKKIEKLARDILTDPVKVVQGTLGEANEDVTQIVKVVQIGGGKWNWLIVHLVELTSIGSVLIFVTKKANAEELATNLRARDFTLGLLHGDMDQNERNKVISSFKKQEMSVLVATDVAARGLDIPHIKTVVNYDVARDIDTHTHRVGRTGRAGEKGTAYTLVTSGDKEFAGHIVRNLEGAGQIVPEELLNLALQSNWFRKSRFKSGKGRRPNVGGRGLGFTEKSSKPAETYLASMNYGSAQQQELVASMPPQIPPSTPSSTSVENSDYTSRPGPGSDRLSAMKAAFRAQYKSQFCAATPSIAPMSATSFVSNANRSSSAERPRKKSRWD